LAEAPTISDELRAMMLKIMLHCSKRSGLCPRGLIIENVRKLGNHPLSWGRYGDVWKGTIDGSKQVDFMREGIVWQQLKHPNVLPFIGMCYLDSEAQKQLSLVSPWMDGGNLTRFLKDTPRERVVHLSLAYDVASGLSYLHGMKIVHRDLKGVSENMMTSACFLLTQGINPGQYSDHPRGKSLYWRFWPIAAC
ncbi:kinase-like protein, partial [Marasmius fiardii PR-910]